MILSPSLSERLARLRADFRSGVPAIVEEGVSGWVSVPVETVSPARFETFRSLGDLELVITDWRARGLKTWSSDGQVARILVPDDAGLDWAKAMADPVDDLNMPLKGPFQVVTDGSESAAHAAVLDVCKAAHLLPAALMVKADLPQKADLQHFALADVVEMVSHAPRLARVSAAPVPLSVAQDARVSVFRPDDGGEEHYVVELGQPDRAAPVLTRLHSACFTGDILGSLKCDCGPQLNAALAQMAEEKAGLILYMNQEGRGIGLANKMRAYSLQDQGFDTVDANHRLGFEDDERDFRLGSLILQDMGFRAVRLMTNNPAKLKMMEDTGITVTERVPLRVGHNPTNAGYLATKAKKSGHLL